MPFEPESNNFESYFDVIVIGAGIQGAGVAQACSVQGLSVCVLEQYSEPAMGTSSKSSKLIHGGLRYLESAQIRLVYECLRERKILCRIAPNLVTLQKFHLPIYTQERKIKGRVRRSSMWVALGLLTYFLLSGLSKSGRFGLGKISDFVKEGLLAKNLERIFYYFDAQTDDKALTQSVLQSCLDYGGSCKFNCVVEQIHQEKDGYKVVSAGGDVLFSRSLVNAAGPWVDVIQSRVSPPIISPKISLVQGSHLVLNVPNFKHYFYCESPRDSRPLFFLPWKGKVLVGTTERKLDTIPSTIQCSDEEKSYLLDAFNEYFPDYKAGLKDIEETFAGLRVLPGIGEQLNTKVRETILHIDKTQPRYISIYGGKLTAYRSTGEKVGRYIHKQLNVARAYKNTDTIRLP